MAFHKNLIVILFIFIASAFSRWKSIRTYPNCQPFYSNQPENCQMHSAFVWGCTPLTDHLGCIVPKNHPMLLSFYYKEGVRQFKNPRFVATVVDGPRYDEEVIYSDLFDCTGGKCWDLHDGRKTYAQSFSFPTIGIHRTFIQIVENENRTNGCCFGIFVWAV